MTQHLTSFQEATTKSFHLPFSLAVGKGFTKPKLALLSDLN